MTMSAFRWGALAAFTFTLFCVMPAQAQSVYWVKSNGDDGNPCTFSQPCATIQGAYNVAPAGSEIRCVNAASYDTNAFAIAHSITIDCTEAPATIAGFLINTGVNAVVVLRGLDINAFREDVGGIFPVDFIGGGTLILDKVKVAGWQNAGGGLGIRPSRTATVLVSNSFIADNGSGGNVLIRPTGSAPLAVTFKNDTISNSVFGIKADGSGQASGQVDVDVNDSVAAGNANNGFIAVSNAGQAPIHFKVTHSVAFNNGAYGVVATGAEAFMIVDNSSLTKNGTGLAQLSDATVATYGNVAVNYNTTQITGTITPISLH